MSSSYRNELNKWLSRLDVKAETVLDIGGSQEKLPPRVRSWEVHKYLIADLPNPHKNSEKPDLDLDLNQEPPDYYKKVIYKQPAQCIFCLEVFEYVWNPVKAFEIIEKSLKKGGSAWVTFPSVYPIHEPIEDDALRYMYGGIKKLAQAVGLNIVQIIPRHFDTNKWQETISIERLRGAKQSDHSISGWIAEFTK